MRRITAAGFVVAAGLGAVTCASAPNTRAGTGDLAFRLTWPGAADLDLYVVDPAGERIDFLHRRAASGGELDVDCNVLRVEFEEGEGEDPAEMEPARYIFEACDPPMENVYWRRGSSVPGEYQVTVLLARPGEGTGAGEYSLQVLVRGRERLRFTGAVGQLVATPGRWVVVLDEAGSVQLAPDGGG